MALRAEVVSSEKGGKVFAFERGTEDEDEDEDENGEVMCAAAAATATAPN